MTPCEKNDCSQRCHPVVTKAMEIVGGGGFYQNFGLERFYRNIQGIRYHPLPEKDQLRFSGEYL